MAGARGQRVGTGGQSDTKDTPRGTGVLSALGVLGLPSGVPEVIWLWVEKVLGSGWEKLEV